MHNNSSVSEQRAGRLGGGSREPSATSGSSARSPEPRGANHECYKTSPALSTNVLSPICLGRNCLTLIITVHSTLANGFQHLL